MGEIRLKWWIYLLCAVSACAFIVAGGGALLYIFGVPLLLFATHIGVFIAGSAVILIYPPPVTSLLLQMLETLEVLLSDRTSVQQPSSGQNPTLHPEVPRFSAYATFSPHPPAVVDYYLVMVRAQEGANNYLKSLSPEGSVTFTHDPDEAQKFPRFYSAKNSGWLAYIQLGCQHKIEIVGIQKAIAQTPIAS